MGSAWSWLHRHDPGLLTVRRAARVALVACLGFSVCRYLLGNPAMATYALFGAVALGALSQIPGSPRQRARTLVAVLPVGWVLVGLGTLLSVNTAPATIGMFVLGFVVSFAGSAGRGWSASRPGSSCSTSCPASRRTTPARWAGASPG